MTWGLENYVERYFSILNCSINEGPFLYLWMSEGNLGELFSWQFVIDKIKKKLARSEGINLSVEGRVYLIKSKLSLYLCFCYILKC